MTILDRLKYDFWVTADRQFLFFHEMSTSHLNNTIAMLIRKAPELQGEANDRLGFWSGDLDEHPCKWLSRQTAFKGLIAERKRRKADVI